MARNTKGTSAMSMRKSKTAMSVSMTRSMRTVKSPSSQPRAIGMTISEAGCKGGSNTAKRYGHEFYQEIGTKGGARVRELINEGKKERGEV